MKHRLFLSLITAGVLASQASAGTMGPVMAIKDRTWVGSVSTDPVWARGGETQTFYLAPEIEKTYVSRKSNHALASVELFVGIQKSLSSQSAVPLWTIVPAPGSNPTQTVPENSASTVQYVVQNQSGRAKQLVIQSIPGIAQTTTCQLAPKGQAGSRCILNLAITGSSLPKVGIHGGPNVCQANANGHPNPNQCYRPNAAHILNIGKGTAEQAAITVNPAALDLVANSGMPGVLTITNNSTSITAQNVQALLPAATQHRSQHNCRSVRLLRPVYW